MAIRKYPTKQRLRELFYYSEQPYVLSGRLIVGGLIWRTRVDKRGRPNVRYAGNFAGVIRKGDGRVQVGVDGKLYELNRLIWIWHNGVIAPGLVVDHANRDTDDNTIDNFRLANLSENNCNRSKGQGCSSKFKGVYLKPETGRWCAQIKKNGETVHLGTYATEELAAKARDEALGLHGEFGLPNAEIAPC